MRRYLILIVLLLIPLIPLGLFALGVIKRPVRTPTPVTLTVWAVNGTEKSYDAIVKQYNTLRPYISVKIETVTADSYAGRLKDAWARGKGPDVFELPASWIGEFSTDFLLPAPASTNVFTYFSKKVLFRTNIEIKQTNIPSITAPQVRKEFADVVADDVVRDNKVYGLPLSIDTLILYYNRDILRSANVVEPPKAWSQLAAMVPKLTIADESGKILQSGVALGTGANVAHAADIMSLLFLQDGVELNDPDGNVLLDDSVSNDGTNLGVNALTFYTSFADSGKEVYAWNTDQPKSLEAFARGKTAMYIGYGSDRSKIEQAGSVNFGIAPILHLDANGKDALLTPAGNALQVNFGNYWVNAVFKRTEHPDEAWNFVQYMTRQDQIAGAYLKATSQVGALRTILAKQADDPEIGVIAQQAISARSWYHGRNATAVEGYLTAMIDNVVDQKASVLEALSTARKQIELTTKKLR